jgi:hypothetical protein
VCVFITAVCIIKLFAWGEGDSGGHVLRETTTRGLCVLITAVAIVKLFAWRGIVEDSDMCYERHEWDP